MNALVYKGPAKKQLEDRLKEDEIYRSSASKSNSNGSGNPV